MFVRGIFCCCAVASIARSTKVQPLAASRLQHKVKSVILFQPRNRSRSRSHHPHSLMPHLLKPPPQQPGVAQRLLLLIAAHHNIRQRVEWRIVHPSPEAQLLFRKAVVVMPRRKLHRVVIRKVRLQHHLAEHLTAPGSPGHLGQQLKRPLGGAKIRQPQRRIRAHHPHQRHAMHVVSLGDHLRPHQQVDLARLELRSTCAQNRRVRAPCRDPCAQCAPSETPHAACLPASPSPSPKTAHTRCRTSDKSSAPAADSRSNGTAADADACDTSSPPRSRGTADVSPQERHITHAEYPGGSAESSPARRAPGSPSSPQSACATARSPCPSA